MLNRFFLGSFLMTMGVLLLCQEPAKAQDPQFTQFYANPLYLNPAFAGTARCPRVAMNYRNQWPGLSGSFVTTSASYDQHVRPLQGGLGLLVLHDRAGNGVLNTTAISGMYSYQQAVSRDFSIKVGFQATYYQKSLDFSRLQFGDQIDSRKGFIFDTSEEFDGGQTSVTDFSAGVLGFSENYFIGFAAHHLTEPDESLIAGESPLPRKYTGHAGAIIPLDNRGRVGSNFSISPNVLYQQQGDFSQLNVGMYAIMGPIVGGLWYRNQDSFIALLGVESDNIRFGYSYDLTISPLSTSTAGSHEISFGLQLGCKPVKKKFRTIKCPTF